MIPHTLDAILPNREQWLTATAVLLRPWFSHSGLEIPFRVRLGVGSLGESRRALGACYCATDQAGFRHVTISPFIDDPLFVAAVLVHELIHASLPPEERHGRRFRAAALKLGLEGRLTEVRAGAALQQELERVTKRAGPYPHKAIC